MTPQQPCDSALERAASLLSNRHNNNNRHLAIDAIVAASVLAVIGVSAGSFGTGCAILLIDFANGAQFGKIS